METSTFMSNATVGEFLISRADRNIICAPANPHLISTQDLLSITHTYEGRMIMTLNGMLLVSISMAFSIEQ